MRTLSLVLVLLATAEAGRRKKSDADVTAPPPEPAAPVADTTPWFPTLPMSQGTLPSGLANPTAQGCAACHPTEHEAWQAGGHAGPPSAALLEAAARADSPSCTACHLPLQVQRPQAGPFGFGPDMPLPTPQPFSATLWNEGVGCAACHVRDGAVLSTHPGDADAPHPLTFSATLGGSEGCATCHQLDLGGATVYDTYGEWSRSPYADAGIGCSDCHGGATRHSPLVPGSVGVTVLVDLDRATITRGGDPLDVSIVLQNTGAGHAYPTGSPYRGVRLSAALVGPGVDRQDVPAEVAPLAVDLARTLDAAWATTSDTRLAPMASASFPWTPALPQDAPGGQWYLEVRLHRTVSGAVTGDPIHLTRVPLQVD